MSCLKWFTKRDDRKQAGCHFEIQYRRQWFWQEFFLGTEMVHQHSIVSTTNPPIRMLDQWKCMYMSRLRWFTKWDSRKQAGCHVTIQYHRQWFWHEFFLGTEMVHQHSIISTTNPTISMPGQWKLVHEPLEMIHKVRWSETSWLSFRNSVSSTVILARGTRRLDYLNNQPTSLNNWTTKAHVHEPLEMIRSMKQSKTSWLSSCISESSTVIFCLNFLWHRKAHFMINWLLFFVLEVSVSSMLSKEYALTCKSQLMAITALQITSLSSASSWWSAWNATKWKESG